MRGVVWKLISHPRRNFPLLLRSELRKLAKKLQGASFFLQGQMDIHPKAYWPSVLANTTGGFYPPGDRAGRLICDLDAHDNTRRDMIVLLLRTVLEKRVAGAFAELGVYRGLTARLIHRYAPERMLYLLDTFDGFTERSSRAELSELGHSTRAFSDTTLEAAQRFVGEPAATVSFHKGFFPESIPPQLQSETFAFVHLDADLYDPTLSGLKFFYPRLARRGILLIHDYNAWPGARRAVDEFFADRAELPIPMPDKSGSALIVKQ